MRGLLTIEVSLRNFFNKSVFLFIENWIFVKMEILILYVYFIMK